MLLTLIRTLISALRSQRDLAIENALPAAHACGPRIGRSPVVPSISGILTGWSGLMTRPNVVNDRGSNGGPIDTGSGVRSGSAVCSGTTSGGHRDAG